MLGILRRPHDTQLLQACCESQYLSHSFVRFFSSCKTEPADPVQTSVTLPLNDSLAYVVPERKWGNIEFYNDSQRDTVESILTYRKAYDDQRRQEKKAPGKFVNELRPTLIFLDSVNVIDRIAETVNGTRLERLYTSSNQETAELVSEGFAIRLKNNAYLYGLGNEVVVDYLSATASDEPSYKALAEALARLSVGEGLFLVDWQLKWILFPDVENSRVSAWLPK